MNQLGTFYSHTLYVRPSALLQRGVPAAYYYWYVIDRSATYRCFFQAAPHQGKGGWYLPVSSLIPLHNTQGHYHSCRLLTPTRDRPWTLCHLLVVLFRQVQQQSIEHLQTVTDVESPTSPAAMTVNQGQLIAHWTFGISDDPASLGQGHLPED